MNTKMPIKNLKQKPTQKKKKIANPGVPNPLFIPDKRKTEGGMSHFKYFHIFYNHKNYTPSDWLYIKPGHRVHIFLSTLYDLSIGENIHEFIAKCDKLTNKKVIIHIPNKAPDKIKILEQLMFPKTKYSIAHLNNWKLYIQDANVWFHMDGYKGSCLVMVYNNEDEVWETLTTHYDRLTFKEKKEDKK